MNKKALYAPMVAVLLGLLMTIINYPFKASDEARLKHGPSAKTMAEVTKQSSEAPGSEVEYRFKVNGRVYGGSCQFASERPNQDTSIVEYLVEDPRINCLSGGYLSSWTYFFAASAFAGVSVIWLMIALFRAPTQESKKTSPKKQSKNRKKRGRKKRKK